MKGSGKLKKKHSNFITEIAIGTPPQYVTAIMDTGSSLIHTGTKDCAKANNKNNMCGAKKPFDSNKSKSFESAHERPFHQAYGGGEMDVKFGYDVVTINGITLDHQRIGLMKKVYADDTFDTVAAIVGLALKPRSDIPDGNIFHNMKREGKLQKNVLGYYLNGDRGMMTFGYINPDLYTGTLHKHDVIEDERWMIQIDDVLVDGKPLHLCEKRRCRGLVDTGTSDFTMPSYAYEKFKEYVKLPEDDTDCREYDKLPRLTLVIGGIKYDLEKEDYVTKAKDEEDGKTYCSYGLQMFDFDPEDQLWLIGEIFLNKYYSVYDMDNKAVHIARRKD